MKFRDGYWGLRDGFRQLRPIDVQDTRIGEDTVTVYATTGRVQHRGDTLNQPLLTTMFDSPFANVIRVRSFHFKPTNGELLRFPSPAEPYPPVTTRICEGRRTLIAGDLTATFSAEGAWALSFEYAGKPMTSVVPKLSGYFISPEGYSYMSGVMSLSVGESVYGLGERFTPFVRNGQIVEVWNEDGGTSSDQAYKNVPLYLTSKGYGLFVAHPEHVSFEIASEVVSAVQFSVRGEYLEYYVIGGGSPKEVLGNYTKLTGKPALPPSWSFGLWLSTSFTTDYNEETVNSFIDGMLARDIPLKVFHFDCFWMREFRWIDLEWDTDAFPDPNGMVSRLAEKGLKLSVWINPYVAQKSPLFEEGIENGYFLKRSDGTVFQWDRWQAGMAIVDFTNPGAVSWFKEKLKRLLDMGIDSFKTDFGERIPTDVVYFDGSDPFKMHNYYSYLYNKEVFELLEGIRGRNNAVVFARSATAGSQRFPVHWGGDCSATYESMAESLRGGLSLGLSGFGFWSHDIGGFEFHATPDLYKRWTAFGLLSSHSRLHGNESYKVPWLYDEESVEVLRFFTKLKYRLMPYIFSEAVRTTMSGVPMMRAMMLEFPADPTCATLDREYMLGEMLLVAPIFSESGEVTFYVPDGVWTSFLTNERVIGGRWFTERHPYLSLPLLVRPNGIVAVGSTDSIVDYDYTSDVCLHLFELADGSSVSTSVVETNGQPGFEAEASRSDQRITVERSGGHAPWSVCLRNVSSVTVVQGQSTREESEGIVVVATRDSDRIIVDLIDN